MFNFLLQNDTNTDAICTLFQQATAKSESIIRYSFDLTYRSLYTGLWLYALTVNGTTISGNFSNKAPDKVALILTSLGYGTWVSTQTIGVANTFYVDSSTNVFTELQIWPPLTPSGFQTPTLSYFVGNSGVLINSWSGNINYNSFLNGIGSRPLQIDKIQLESQTSYRQVNTLVNFINQDANGDEKANTSLPKWNPFIKVFASEVNPPKAFILNGKNGISLTVKANSELNMIFQFREVFDPRGILIKEFVKKKGWEEARERDIMFLNSLEFDV